MSAVFGVVDDEGSGRLRGRGAHPFSSYQLLLTVEPTSEGSRVTAQSRADFPGPAGRVYRLLVVGTRLHGLSVRTMLRAIVRRAERRDA